MISANSASRGLLVRRNKQERHQGSIVRRVDVDTLTQCGRRAALSYSLKALMDKDRRRQCLRVSVREHLVWWRERER